MIRLGVTGHRSLVELEKLEAGVAEALRRVEEAFPGEPWEIVSSLAEGADRLVVRRALVRPGSRLVVILPLPEERYVADFGTPESREEFAALLRRAARAVRLPAAASREEAYEAAGRHLLDGIDLLIALWDGLDAQGRGGTAGIVAEVRRRALPLAWVHAGNRQPGTNEPTSLGAEQGKVTFERFPAIERRA